MFFTELYSICKYLINPFAKIFLILTRLQLSHFTCFNQNVWNCLFLWFRGFQYVRTVKGGIGTIFLGPGPLNGLKFCLGPPIFHNPQKASPNPGPGFTGLAGPMPPLHAACFIGRTFRVSKFNTNSVNYIKIGMLKKVLR